MALLAVARKVRTVDEQPAPFTIPESIAH